MPRTSAECCSSDTSTFLTPGTALQQQGRKEASELLLLLL
jgi:hypothetical protein